MLVIGDNILGKNLILDANPDHIRNASYYLTIGAIIPAGDAARDFEAEEPAKTLVMEPRQMAWVVSNEIFNIKDHGITALVTLRSSFTKRGLLALDVGLVDPDYEGPIGSIVINCSKDLITLSPGEEFFRVVFFAHDEIPEKYRDAPQGYDLIGYIRQRHDEIVSNFPATFLDAQDITKDLHDELLNKLILYSVKNHWLKIFIGLAALIAAVGGIVYLLYLNFGQDLTHETILEFLKENKDIIDIIRGE